MTRPTARRLATLALALAFAPAGGCKWLAAGRDDKAAAPAPKSGDPLLGGRIPATDVPTRDPVAGTPRDPILSTPASRRNHPDPSDLPPRTVNDPGRPPYRPGLSTTPAALAGLSAEADLDLNRNSPPAIPKPISPSPGVSGGVSAGPVPLKPTGFGPGFDQLMTRLKAAGATIEGPFKQGADFTLRATVPLDGDTPGSRSYDGIGPTAAAAAESALEQIKSDRAK